MSILDRYILTELIRPFLMGVGGFIVILIGNTLYLFAELIVNTGVPLKDVVLLLLYSLPANIVITFPVAFVFATLLAIGRMSKDSEFTALRSVGVSFKRMLTPMMLTSLVVSYGAFYVNDEVVPWANRKTVDLVRQNFLRQSPNQMMLKENVFFKDTGVERYFYVRQVDRRANDMYDVFIFDHRAETSRTITGQTARWDKGRWLMQNGVVADYDASGEVIKEQGFKEMAVPVKTDPEAHIASGERSPQEKKARELGEEIEILRGGGTDTRSLEVDYHTKFSLPLSTFFAALVAAPLGARFSRLGGFIGVVFTIILVFIYYVLMTVFRSLGNNGVVDPITGAWAQNYLYAMVGLFLLWRTDK